MGYPMAVNLRTKMEKSQVLLISDISKSALQRFQEQMKDQGMVAIVDTGFDAVQKAVRTYSRNKRTCCDRASPDILT